MDTYKTNKLDLSAYLLMRGHQQLDCQPEMDSQQRVCFFFVFRGIGMDGDVQTFLRNEARVEPNAFCNARRRLLAAIKTYDALPGNTIIR